MIADKYSIDGKVTGKVELPESVFNAEINDVLIYELIKAYNNNMRQGTHSTKRRAEVSGGGIKPWRQKGTGRARQGSIRSPQWRGGGIVFGPHPRSYRIDLPKNIRHEAMVSIFSLKMKEGSIKILEDFQIKEGKTKEVAAIAKNLNIDKGLLVIGEDDILIKRAIRNIPFFAINVAKRLSGRDIFYSKTILITEKAVKHIEQQYGNK